MGYKVNPPSAEELRQLAVQRLDVARAKNGMALSDEQVKRLLEEVAISKIEVEVQNRYLQETCTRLDTALGEINDLYEFAPIGCFSTDASGKITRLNLSGTRLLGAERNALMGRVFVDFFAPHQRQRIEALMQQASTSGEDQHCELQLAQTHGVVQPLQLSLSSRVGGQGHTLVLANRADFRAAEEGEQSREEDLLELRSIQQAIFESLPQYLAVLDGEGRVLRTNALWNAYGLASGHAYRGGLHHAAYADLLDAVSVAGDDRQALLAGIAEVLSAKLPSFQLEYAFAGTDGPRRFVMQAMAVRHARARAVVSHQDVTQFKG
jgi:PAS domain S-box-containing protein